jgi:hypothetical protein
MLSPGWRYVGIENDTTIEKSLQLSEENEIPDNATALSTLGFDIFAETCCIEPTSTFSKSSISTLTAASEKFAESITIEKILNKIRKLFVFIILPTHFF